MFLRALSELLPLLFKKMRNLYKVSSISSDIYTYIQSISLTYLRKYIEFIDIVTIYTVADCLSRTERVCR